jgi:hypothetical protein
MMTSNDQPDAVSVGNEQEPNLKNPDRRRMLGAAAAAAAALGTVGQAASPALAGEFSRKPGGYDVNGGSHNLADISAVKSQVKMALQNINGNNYLHPFRVIPKNQNDGCACGCS